MNVTLCLIQLQDATSSQVEHFLNRIFNCLPNYSIALYTLDEDVGPNLYIFDLHADHFNCGAEFGYLLDGFDQSKWDHLAEHAQRAQHEL